MRCLSQQNGIRGVNLEPQLMRRVVTPIRLLMWKTMECIRHSRKVRHSLRTTLHSVRCLEEDWGLHGFAPDVCTVTHLMDMVNGWNVIRQMIWVMAIY